MEHDLTITQGDEKAYNLAFSAAGNPIDITGATVKMTVKRSHSEEAIAIQKVVTSHSDPTEGKTIITLTSTNTNIPLGSYYYDIQVSGGPFSKKTILKGRLIITWQVTED